jgi:hypothetical protein
VHAERAREAHARGFQSLAAHERCRTKGREVIVAIVLATRSFCNRPPALRVERDSSMLCSRR